MNNHGRYQLSNFEIWVSWLAANVFPWWIGCALFDFVGLLLDEQVDSGWVTVFTLWSLTCALVGIAQWWVLKQRLTGMQWWPLATVFGGAIASLGFFTTAYAIPLVMGGAFGVTQWWVLRRRVRWAWVWILAQVLAALTGMVAALLMPIDAATGNLNESLLVMGTAVEVAASLVTGTTLIFLLRQRQG